MATKKYILPIEATTLAHYYSRACIAPISYLKKGHHDVIQSVYPNALLLTEHYGVKGSNCYLVLHLTEYDFKSNRLKKITDDFYLYIGALPISRVDEIVFISEEQRSTTITNVEMGNAFVRGCTISAGSQFEKVELPEINENIEKDTLLVERLHEFDRVMGALMFMRLANENELTYGAHSPEAAAFSSLRAITRLIARATGFFARSNWPMVCSSVITETSGSFGAGPPSSVSNSSCVTARILPVR